MEDSLKDLKLNLGQKISISLGYPIPNVGSGKMENIFNKEFSINFIETPEQGIFKEFYLDKDGKEIGVTILKGENKIPNSFPFRLIFLIKDERDVVIYQKNETK